MKKRNLFLVLLLSIFTLGIYGIVLYCKLGNETNKICEGDGKKNMFWLLAALLGIVTLGIYPLIWCNKAMERLRDNEYRYGAAVHVPHSGSSYVLWSLAGLFIGIGPFVALCYFVEDINAYADVYGCVQPLPYTPNPQERIYLQSNIPMPMPAPLNAPIAPPMAPPQFDMSPAPSQPEQGYNMQSPIYDDVPATSPAPNIVNANTRSIMGHPPYGQIECINGEYAGGKFEVPHGETLVIGKDSSCCQVVVAPTERYVSRKHASISYNAEMNKYIVTDFSTNGTFTGDGKQLPPMSATYLDHGTIIYLGERTNSFSLN